MKVDVPMDSYAARLASFNATLTTQRKRASDTKGARVLKWPHIAPSISQLAKAGFFYKPTTTNPDNATCYLCHCNLDGWEEEDEPVAEHLKHSPSCGWANIASIEHAIEIGETNFEDPMSERLVDARTMTFGSTWPHESKRGWVCKIQKMVDAGWHYCPTLESDDFVRCAYCNLSLDGWEPKDNPYDEHQRRSPDCLYFSLSASSQTTKGRKPKKSRSSKATRLSTQSRLSVAPEEPSVVENEPDDNGVVSVADAVKPAKGNKGRPKGKKAKAQALTPKQDEMQIASSFVEPEDDDFEVKVAQPATSTARGKKRNSEEMAEETETAGKGAPKRRRTTARTSIASIQADHEEPVETGLAKPVEDVDVTNPDNKPQPSRPMSKKGRKGGKKTGSSMMRKGSSKSTASEASLRAGMPGDEDIDAALEEDLERPLTDDGEDERSDAFKPSKGRRFTRSKLVLKDTSASTAPARRNTRHSTFTSHDSIIELNPATSASHESQMQQAEQVQEPMFHSSPKAKTSKKIGTRKASAKQKVKAQEVKQVEGVSAATAREVEAVKPKQTRGRKASRQALSRGSWTSNMSNSQADVDVVSTIDSSALDIHILEYDSGHETDTTTKSRPTRGRKASTAKKTTENRRAGPKSRNIEDIVQPATSDQLIVEAQDSVTAPAADAKEPEPPAKSLKTHAKKQNKAAKSEQKLKGKKIISKPTEAEGAAVAVGRSEVEGLAETPLLPAAASVHSTPRPALSPQSSDAENQPPSSRPSQSRPPLSFESPVRSQETRVPLAVIATPSASSSKSNLSRLQSTFPWTVMDIDQIFHDLPDTEKEKRHSTNGANMLTSPERRLTVEEWIKYNAQRGEEKLRNDCERLVGRFEDQGVRALKTLEGIVCVD